MKRIHVSASGITAAALCCAMILCGCGASSIKESGALSTSVLSPFSDGSSSEPTPEPGQGFSYEDQLLGDSGFSAPVVSTPAPVTQESTWNTPASSKADFDVYGIPCVLQINEDYICPAIIEKDYSQHSYGTLTVIQYISKPVSDEIKEFGRKNGVDFEGYEMKAVTTQIDFTDAVTGGKNVSIMRKTLDYYNMDAPENGTNHKDHLDRDFLEYEVEYQGVKQPVYFWLNSNWTDYTGYYEYMEDAIFFVPAGYDGVVRGFVNPDRKEKDLRKYHPEEDVLLYRLY